MSIANLTVDPAASPTLSDDAVMPVLDAPLAATATGPVALGLATIGALKAHLASDMGDVVADSVETPLLNLGNDVLMFVGDDVPVDYTDGDPVATGEGTAGPGSLFIDFTNANLYVNGGTKAQPIWKLVARAA